MRRLEVRYRKSATFDLATIYFYLRRSGASAQVADSYVARIRETCRKIADAPEAGNPRDDFAIGLRTWSFERRAVIVYRIEARWIRIVNVFHGGRDIDAFYARLRKMGTDQP